VYDIVIIKAAHHVENGIYLTDVCEKLVAQTFALACPFDQSGDIHNLNCCWRDLFRLYQFRQLVEAWIRYGDDPDVRVLGGKRIIGSERTR
jgi:hypothetical protein